MAEDKNINKEQTKPEKEYKFEGQKADEEIIFHLRRHPMTMYRLGLALSLSALIVIAAYSIWGVTRISSIFLIAYLLIGGFYAFRAWYLWRCSHYILTNYRVVAVDQKNFFHRVVSEANLDKIQNVSYETEGMYQTFVDYGDVKILTAGQKEADVVFRMIPHPYDMQQQITDTLHKFGK